MGEFAESDGQCPARLSFPTAPYLDLRCTEPPGHFPGSLHRVKANVRAALVSYDEHSRGGYIASHSHPAVTHEAVFMQWSQPITSPGLPPAADPTQADVGTEGER